MRATLIAALVLFLLSVTGCSEPPADVAPPVPTEDPAPQAADTEAVEETPAAEPESPAQTIEGSIECIYGNRGGYCEVTASDGSTHTINLSAAETVNWFFEDRPLEVGRVEDVDMTIPVWEEENLTHFQECRARVVEYSDKTDLHIYLEGCAHPPGTYSDIR